MSKRNKQHPQAEQSTNVAVQTTDQQPAPEQPAVPATRSLNVAREANASNPAVNPEAPVRAVLVRPAKGENKERRRVFGYDNGPGGKVPVTAKLVVVNAASLAASYPKLAEAVQLTPQATVADLKTAGVDGKSIRRSFRAGYIRFAQ